MHKFETIFRFFILKAILTVMSATAAPPPADMVENFTGGRTKIIWARSVNENIDADLSNASYKLMGYDTHDGRERVLVPGPISCANPWITSDGQRIVFTSWPDTQVYIADWSGQNLYPLLKGYGLYVWNDPATKREWIYYSDYPYGTVIYRCEIDSITHKELIWNQSKVSIRFRVSADGTHGGGEFPWPNAGEVLLPNISFQQYGSGCNAQIAPDNSYRFFVLEGGHHAIFLCDSGKTDCREIPVSSILGSQSTNTIWAPKWSNDPRFLTCKVDELQDIYLGKFNDSFTAVQEWMRITDNNIDIFDNYAYAWIGSTSRMSFSPDSLFFELDSNGQGTTTHTVYISNIHDTLPQLRASTTASWLSLQVTGNDNEQSILNVVSPAALSSGIYSTTVMVSGENIPSEQYVVTLRINGRSTASSIKIAPSNPLLPCSTTMQFSVQVYDQFHTIIGHTANWRCDSGGSISDNGLFQNNGSIGCFIISACDSGNNLLCDTTSVTIYKDLIITSPTEGESFRTGDTMHLQWTGKPANLQGVVVSLSLNSGKTWTRIHDHSIGINDPDWGNSTWIITDSIDTDDGILPCISNRCRIKIADYNQSTTGNFYSIGHFSITGKDENSFRRSPNRRVPEIQTRISNNNLMLWSSGPFCSVDIYTVKGVCITKYRAQPNTVTRASFRLNSGLYIVKTKTLDRTFMFTCVVP
jgi:hypothetical protein